MALGNNAVPAPSTSALPTPENSFIHSFDARDWAAGFTATLKANPNIAADEETMVTWFANALMRGYDHATQKSIPSPSAYNNWAFEPILHQHFNQLRARLMNLAESSTRDRQQSDAMKGLMKDFVNEAYFPALRDMQSFLRDKGVIPQGDDKCGGPHSTLTAKSLNDILYEPEA